VRGSPSAGPPFSDGTLRRCPGDGGTRLPRLGDPGFTKVFIVSLPEATPVHEAKGLVADLRRAGIQPFAWVLNQALSPLHLTDPVLRARARQEQNYLQEVASTGLPWTLIPWMIEPLGPIPTQAQDRPSSEPAVLGVQP